MLVFRLNNTSVLSDRLRVLAFRKYRIPAMPYESHLNTYHHCLHLVSYYYIICKYYIYSVQKQSGFFFLGRGGGERLSTFVSYLLFIKVYLDYVFVFNFRL